MTRRGARTAATALVLLASALALYLRVAGFSFLESDDPSYVVRNEMVRRGLTWQGLRWSLSSLEAANWHPLTWVSHMLDVELFGLHAGGHHLTSAAIHGLGAAALFLALQALSGAWAPSAVAAALFALHPLAVESVAWVAERKNVLSTLLWFLGLAAYARYARRPAPARFLLVFAALALGLMSKPMLVTFPLTCLLLDYWPLGRMHAGVAAGTGGAGRSRPALARLVAEKVPLLAAAALAGALTLLAQSRGGAVAPLEQFTAAARLSNAVVAGAAYGRHALWPSGLSHFYAHRGDAVGAGAAVAAAAALLAITAGAYRIRRRAPYALVGWSWFLVTLAPVIGIVQVGMQGMANRYAYVPIVGLALAAVWGVRGLLAGARRGPAIAGAACGATLAALALLTWREQAHWRDSSSVLARYLERGGFTDRSGGGLVETLRQGADTPETLERLGALLAQGGDPRTAAAHLAAAVARDPQSAAAHLQLARVLAALRDGPGAEREFAAALRLEPGSGEVHAALGTFLAGAGRGGEALAHLEEAVRLGPPDPVVRNNLGALLAERGRLREARGHFEEALRLRPDYAGARSNLERLQRDLGGAQRD